jgi:flagellar basal-body rod modification protein FlgD
MALPISGVAGTYGTAASKTAGTAGTTGTAKAPPSKSEMDKDLFLKLLVAQLKYQDPTSPADPTQFVTQTAQFSMVEKLDAVAKAQEQLVTAQLMTTATSLVGRTISYSGDDGISHTGVVASATISGSNPTVKVGNTDVPLSSVREVQNAAAKP